MNLKIRINFGGLSGILQILLIILKLTKVLDISWLVVFLPTIIPTVVVSTILLGIFIHAKTKKIKERRIVNNSKKQQKSKQYEKNNNYQNSRLSELEKDKEKLKRAKESLKYSLMDEEKEKNKVLIKK